jgi:plastocyanin
MRGLFGLVAVAGLLIASAAAMRPAYAEDNTVAVTVRDDRFADSRQTVPAGTTVTWTHKGNNGHTVTALDGSFDSGLLERGDEFSFTFSEPGIYQYICRQHILNGMRGTITVE